jgi:hypothetical protein
MVIGAGISILLGQGLSFILFGVAAGDVTMLLGVTALLSATALVAYLVPDRRATMVDPLVAMRAEQLSAGGARRTRTKAPGPLRPKYGAATLTAASCLGPPESR